MAFEADCDVSTVLEAHRVASTVGSFVPAVRHLVCRARVNRRRQRSELRPDSKEKAMSHALAAEQLKTQN